MISQFINKIWQEAYKQNTSNIMELLEKNVKAQVVDIGCGDGQKTLVFKNKIGCKEIIGMDGITKRLTAARKRGIQTKIADIEKKWPFPNNFFDVVISNQVIEHLIDI